MTKFLQEVRTTNEASWLHGSPKQIQMAAAAILNFGKMSITPDWIKISCIKLYGKMHHGHTEMTTEVNTRDVIK